jgi:hypothetical protein
MYNNEKLFEKILKKGKIESFGELSAQLLNLHGILGMVLQESYFFQYNKSKGNTQLLNEAKKEISHRLGQFWQQARIYENQLNDYMSNRTYKTEKHQDKLLSLYADTRKKSIKSIKNLIRFLTYEQEHEEFNLLNQGIHQLIVNKNRYIESVWTIVQNILADQIAINEQRGINTQEKYQLLSLNLQDIMPNDYNPSYNNLNQLLTDLTQGNK